MQPVAGLLRASTVPETGTRQFEGLGGFRCAGLSARLAHGSRDNIRPIHLGRRWGAWRMEQLVSVTVWIITILFGVILTVVLNEPLRAGMARIAAGVVPRSPRNLTGYWRLEYEFTLKGARKREIQIIEIRSVFGAVTGRTVFSQFHSYEVRGRLRQEFYFTGTWHSVLPGQAYHGSFQLILQADGSALTGKWLGFSEKLRVVNHGVWTWTRMSHTRSTAARLISYASLPDRE